MLKKSFFSFIIFFTLITVVNANVDPTGNTLLKYCESEIIFMDEGGHLSENIQQNVEQVTETFYCQAFTNGVIQMEELVSAAHRSNKEGNDTKNSIFCIPDDVTLGQIIRIQVDYMKSHPEKLHLPAVVFTIESLVKAFPCDDNTETNVKNK